MPAGVARSRDATKINAGAHMNAKSRWAVALTLMLGTIYGQQQPDPTPSGDSFGDSAYGTNALLNLNLNLTLHP
jgi:hypothetical protein